MVLRHSSPSGPLHRALTQRRRRLVWLRASITPQGLQSLRNLKVQTIYLESWVISLVSAFVKIAMRYTDGQPCFTPLKIRQFEMDTILNEAREIRGLAWDLKQRRSRQS